MNKEEKIDNLLNKIYIKCERIRFLLWNVIHKSDSEIETQVLAKLAFNENKRISKMSEKIGRILKH